MACPALPHFSTLSHKWYDLWRNASEHTICVLIFSTTFVSNICHPKKNSARYYNKRTQTFMYSTRFYCQISNLNFLYSFSKNNFKTRHPRCVSIHMQMKKTTKSQCKHKLLTNCLLLIHSVVFRLRYCILLPLYVFQIIHVHQTAQKSNQREQKRTDMRTVQYSTNGGRTVMMKLIVTFRSCATCKGAMFVV